MTTGAGANLPRLKREPVALLDDTSPIGVGQMPARCPLGRNNRGHRTVIPDPHAAGGPGGIGHIQGRGVMQGIREDTAAGQGHGAAARQSPQLVGLEKLEITDIVDFSGVGSQRLGVAPRDL